MVKDISGCYNKNVKKSRFGKSTFIFIILATVEKAVNMQDVD